MPLFGARKTYVALATKGESETEKEPLTAIHKNRFEELGNFEQVSRPRRWWKVFPVYGALMGLICVLLIVDISLRYHQSARYCNWKLSVPSPLLEPASSRQIVVFNNSLTAGGSPWRQGPNEKVDLMWESIIHEGLIAISDEEVRNLGKDPSNFRRVPPSLHPKYGDKVLAGTEFSHHIHCLNMVRKFTYFEHYREMPSEFDFYNVSMKLVRTHIDHCIDTIRQVLMCHPDDGLYLSYWIEGRRGPMADFNTMHKCKDFQAMMSWAGEHEIKEKLSEYPVKGEVIWTRKHHP